MKKEIRLYNIFFPIWLILLFYPLCWLVVLPVNFGVDLLVIVLTLRALHADNIKIKAKKSILKVWLFGFLADIIGGVLLFSTQFIDMFLEKQLPADGTYTEEVERVRKLFDAYVENPDGVYTTFVEYEWGEWRVLAWYDGQSPFEYTDPDYYSPDHRTDRVSLFAYHDGTRKVRYAQYERAEYSGLLTTPYKPHFVALPWGEEAA